MEKFRGLLKYFVFSILAICIVTVLSGNKISAVEGEMVTIKFQDKCLYNVFKNQGGTQSSNDEELSVTLSKSSVENYDTLWANSEGITNLSGIENFTNLKELHLVDNEITDISYLSNLKKLKKLDLNKNQIKNVDSLKGLEELKELDIEKNQISDISPLENLKKLERLNIGYNKVRDLSKVESFTNLKKLLFSENILEENDVKEIDKLVNMLNNLTFVQGKIYVTKDTVVLPAIFMDEENCSYNSIGGGIYELSEDGKTTLLKDTTSAIVNINNGTYKNSSMYVEKISEDELKDKLNEAKHIDKSSISSNININLVSLIIDCIILICVIIIFVIMIKKGIINGKIFIILCIVIILCILGAGIYFGVKTFKNNNLSSNSNNNLESNTNNSQNNQNIDKGLPINLNGYDVYVGYTKYEDFVKNTKFEEKSRKNENANKTNFKSYNSDGYSTIEMEIQKNIIYSVTIYNNNDEKECKLDSNNTSLELPGNIKINGELDSNSDFLKKGKDHGDSYYISSTEIGNKCSVLIYYEKNSKKVENIYIQSSSL